MSKLKFNPSQHVVFFLSTGSENVNVPDPELQCLELFPMMHFKF